MSHGQRLAGLTLVLWVASAGAEASDLDHFCSAWKAQCDPTYTCPQLLPTTGAYGVHFQLNHREPGASFEESGILVRNDNTNVAVRVRYYGISTNTNLYFQNDAIDAASCPRPCVDPDPHCPEPACQFGHECCPGCTGGCSDTQTCEILVGSHVCGCEIEDGTLPLLPGQQQGKNCNMPGPFAAVGNCDISGVCAYISPNIEDGVHFDITEVSFDDGGCWYTPETIHIPTSSIVVDETGCPTFDGSNWRRSCPDP